METWPWKFWEVNHLQMGHVQWLCDITESYVSCVPACHQIQKLTEATRVCLKMLHPQLDYYDYDYEWLWLYTPNFSWPCGWPQVLDKAAMLFSGFRPNGMVPAPKDQQPPLCSCNSDNVSKAIVSHLQFYHKFTINGWRILSIYGLFIIALPKLL